MSPKKGGPPKKMGKNRSPEPVQLDLSLNRAFGADDVHVAAIGPVASSAGRNLARTCP